MLNPAILRIDNVFFDLMPTGDPNVPYRLIKRYETGHSMWPEPNEKEDLAPVLLKRLRTDHKRLHGRYRGKGLFFIEDAPSRLRRVAL